MLYDCVKTFPCYRMAIILNCLHSVGILFSMKHLFSIVSRHLGPLGPRLFSCSTKNIISPSGPDCASYFRNKDVNKKGYNIV